MVEPSDAPGGIGIPWVGEIGNDGQEPRIDSEVSLLVLTLET